MARPGVPGTVVDAGTTVDISVKVRAKPCIDLSLDRMEFGHCLQSSCNLTAFRSNRKSLAPAPGVATEGAASLRVFLAVARCLDAGKATSRPPLGAAAQYPR